MTQTRYTYILGSPDPEMQANEGLLTEAGLQVGYACVEQDGRLVRCHPGNAYKATHVMCGQDCIWPPEEPERDITPPEVVYIECDVPGLPAALIDPAPAGKLDDGEAVEVVPAPVPGRFDHHWPGDAGYGRPPADFLIASSIGQVIVHLALIGRLPEGWGRDKTSDHAAPAGKMAFRPGDDISDGWVVKDSPETVSIIPSEIVLAAAADHCLAAAYRGECPGVDPDELMEWRAKTRAEFQKRPVEDVLADVNRARETLLYYRRTLASVAHIAFWHVADIRGQSVPEAPEAATREGLPMLASMTDRDGRTKVVLQSAPPELVREFLADTLEVKFRLVNTYGDPERGFAGGYLPS